MSISIKDWAREVSTPIVDAVHAGMGVVQAGKGLLDEGGEAAELSGLAKKVSIDAVGADKTIMDNIQYVVALYQEAARLIRAQTDGLGTQCRLADSYMERVTVYNKVLATLGDPPEQPPETDVEWNATQSVQLRQAKAGLGLQRRWGRESGRHESSSLCMEEDDRMPVRTQEYNVTPLPSNQTDDTHFTLPSSCLTQSDASTISDSPQLHYPPLATADLVGSDTMLQSIDCSQGSPPTTYGAADLSASGRAMTNDLCEPASSPHNLELMASSSREFELMGKLDRELEHCRRPVQDGKATPSIVLCMLQSIDCSKVSLPTTYSAAGRSESGRAATNALCKPASSSHKLELMASSSCKHELMEELDQEFEQCRTPVQSEKAMPSIVPCKDAFTSQLSSPRAAYTDRTRMANKWERIAGKALARCRHASAMMHSMKSMMEDFRNEFANQQEM